jgi:predicted nucleic acid-binding Zn ribbon protein
MSYPQNAQLASSQHFKKIISASGFRLSVSEWYETDFKSSKKKNLTSDSNSDS